jgi:cytochrome oxidase Cu insertion factor (SCO1/SenC/PrrC family)
MVRTMSQTAQPGFLSSWLRAFAALTARSGFAVNLITVAALAVIGLALLSGQRRALRAALALLLLLSAATWVLVQDLGVFGGLGTDPNSMIPLALIVAGGYLALAPGTARQLAPAAAGHPGPAVAAGPEPVMPTAAAAPDAAPVAAGPEPVMPTAAVAPAAPVAAPAAGGGPRPGWRERLGLGRLAQAVGTASPRTVAAVGALGVAIIGVIPLATAAASATASPIIAQALDGSSAPLDFRAPAFRLTNQHGHRVSLASLRGKVVLLTFLDPVCTSDCPLIAQEFKQADQLLGGQARQVELVAVVTNPVYHQLAYTQAFDRQERLGGLPNWQYLTGSVPQLRQVWRQYGIAAQILPAGGMIGHSDLAYVIDRSGRTRRELNFDPGPGTASSQASFANELSSAAQQNLRAS